MVLFKELIADRRAWDKQTTVHTTYTNPLGDLPT